MKAQIEESNQKVQMVQLETRLQYYEEKFKQLQSEHQITLKENEMLSEKVEQQQRVIDEQNSQLMDYQVSQIKLQADNDRLSSSNQFYMKLISNYENQKQSDEIRQQNEERYHQEQEQHHTEIIQRLYDIQKKLKKCSSEHAFPSDSITQDLNKTIEQLQNTCMTRFRPLDMSSTLVHDNPSQETKELQMKLQQLIDERRNLKEQINKLFSDDFLNKNGLTKSELGLDQKQ